jgi:hypothetical protein
VLLAAVAAITAIGSQAAPAWAATPVPPTITSAFTPNLIGVGNTTSLSVTITNPNSSGALSSVAFTDTLPGGLTVDNPNGENGSCGTSSLVTAISGSQTISLVGGSLKAAATCTLSVAVTDDQAETVQNNTGPVSSSAGASGAGDTETLTVLAAPTVTVVKPRDNAKYTYGGIVRANYSCAQPGAAQDLADCSAQDDLGNDIASGGKLDTTSPGAHSLLVSATSADGLVTTDTVNYTVLPDNKFTISHVTPGTGGTLAFALSLPGAGKVKVLEVAAGRVAFGEVTLRVTGKRDVKVTVAPTAAGAALLSANGSAQIVLEVTYTPRGGVKRTLDRRGIRLI